MQFPTDGRLLELSQHWKSCMKGSGPYLADPSAYLTLISKAHPCSETCKPKTFCQYSADSFRDDCSNVQQPACL